MATAATTSEAQHALTVNPDGECMITRHSMIPLDPDTMTGELHISADELSQSLGHGDTNIDVWNPIGVKMEKAVTSDVEGPCNLIFQSGGGDQPMVPLQTTHREACHTPIGTEMSHAVLHSATGPPFTPVTVGLTDSLTESEQMTAAAVHAWDKRQPVGGVSADGSLAGDDFIAVGTDRVAYELGAHGVKSLTTSLFERNRTNENFLGGTHDVFGPVQSVNGREFQVVSKEHATAATAIVTDAKKPKHPFSTGAGMTIQVKGCHGSTPNGSNPTATVVWRTTHAKVGPDITSPTVVPATSAKKYYENTAAGLGDGGADGGGATKVFTTAEIGEALNQAVESSRA